MSNIVVDFNTDVAKNLDTDCAIILSKISSLQKQNESEKKNFQEGKYWVCKSVEDYLRIFFYLSKGRIRRCLDKLEKHKYIVSGKFSESSFDRTKWYSVNSKI